MWRLVPECPAQPDTGLHSCVCLCVQAIMIINHLAAEQDITAAMDSVRQVVLEVSAF